MKGSKVYVLADWYCGAYKGRSMSNPPIKPRRKKMKNGKYRKEPAKSYIQRFMGDKKMNKEFPDDAQRYAVGINYVDKIYGKGGLKSIGVNPGEKYSSDYMVRRDVHKLHKSGEAIKDTYYEGLEVPEWWKSKMSVTADQADNLADALAYVADNPRSNPPKDKIEKGKKLYKHMNGVDPQRPKPRQSTWAMFGIKLVKVVVANRLYVWQRNGCIFAKIRSSLQRRNQERRLPETIRYNP